MARPRFSSPTKLEIARQWLRDNMEAGNSYNAGELQQRAIADEIKRRTLQLAATYETEIDAVHGSKDGKKGILAWQWKLK